MATVLLLFRVLIRMPHALMLAFVPYPIGPLTRLFGYQDRPNGAGIRLQFCTLGNFVCMCHLILAGWGVGLLAIIDSLIRPHGYWVPLGLAVWAWLAVLITTVAVLAFRVDRYVLFLLVSWVVTMGLLTLVVELISQLPLIGAILFIMVQIPVAIEWGVPVLISCSLGLLYAGAVTWAQLNDVWSVPKELSNEIHHNNFERRDRSIYRPGRTFVADFPCLLRKYLFFGYGNIEIRSSAGRRMDLIEGVVFAEYYARKLVRDQLVHARAELEEEALRDELDGEDEYDDQAAASLH